MNPRRGLQRCFGLGLFAAVLVSARPAAAVAAEDFPKGAVVDRVVCRADGEQSYALYLPSAYDCARRWPILFCFDPGARGKVAVNVFRDAAEQYGYIVVGSNNSKNGPWEIALKAIRAVWADTRDRFCIDDRRVYSAGHSGGAHVALLFPMVVDRPTAGVIAICNGLPEAFKRAAIPKDLAVFVSTGLFDFNYWPARGIGPALDAAGVANHLQIFHGEHQWPPSPETREALAWLDLQAMKMGKRERDEAWITAQFVQRLRIAREAENDKRTIDAFEAYRALASDFRGLTDVAEIEGRLAELKKSPDVVGFPQTAKAMEDDERRQFSAAAQMLAGIVNAFGPQGIQAPDQRRRITNLRRGSEDDVNPNSAAAKRRVSRLFAQVMNAAGDEYARKDMERAAALFEAATLLRPNLPAPWYDLASVYSRVGEKTKALQALESAVQNGMNDVEFIEKDADLDAIRNEPAYARLIEKLKKDRAPAKK